MLDLLNLFIPFFALVALGWGAVHIGLLTPIGVRAINTFVLFFGLPAMIFLLAAGGAFSSQSVGPMLLAYGLSGTVILIIACWLYGKATLRRQDSGLLALATVFPNTGFLGLPLLTALLGSAVAGPVMATLLVDVLWLSSLGLMWASLGTTSKSSSSSAQKMGLGSLLRQSFGGALRNPLPWSMVAGLCAHTLGWTAPSALEKTLNLLSLTASPTALFALGGVLHSKAKEAHVNAALPRPWVLPAGLALKLVAHPTLVAVIGWLLQQAGWPLSPMAWLTLVMVAALPSASNVLLLAERRQAQSVWVGRLIFWATTLSIVSMMAWFTLLS